MVGLLYELVLKLVLTHYLAYSSGGKRELC